ncbi:MAG: hypothetical protein GX868_07600 [Actinobacteria bacterium]|nr:hypothetical protein [Actinomycetota bacterium]
MSERLATIHELLRTVSEADLVAARTALHTLAERVLAPDLYRATRRVGLRPCPGGFGQPEHFVDGERRRLRVDGDSIVVLHGVSERRAPLSTLARVAQFCGAPLGPGDLPYEASSPSDPNGDLAVTPAAASLIATVLSFGNDALELTRTRTWQAGPTIVEFWPEHFDLASRIGAVMIGVSPGDATTTPGGRRRPYLYVAPPTVPPEDDYWNEPYGAAIGFEEIRSLDHAVAFFVAGLENLDTV